MSTDTPVFAYEEVTDGEVTEPVETPAEDAVVDIASLSPEDRLAHFQKLAEDNARLRAELQAALTKASAPSSTRARKDPERDAKVLTQVVKDVIELMPEQTTEKSVAPFRRYVGSVDIANSEGTTERYHATVVVKKAKRG